MLTGKTKQDFEKWLINNFNRDVNEVYLCEDGFLWFNGKYFYSLPFSMQYGVLIDFFREKLTSVDYLDLLQGIYNSQWLTTETLHEARTKAIEKAIQYDTRTKRG